MPNTDLNSIYGVLIAAFTAIAALLGYLNKRRIDNLAVTVDGRLTLLLAKQEELRVADVRAAGLQGRADERADVSQAEGVAAVNAAKTPKSEGGGA